MSHMHWKKRLSVPAILLASSLAGAVSISLVPGGFPRASHAQATADSAATQSQLARAADLSQAFQHVAKTLRPSVVSVISEKKPRRLERIRRGGPRNLPPELRRFFGDDEDLLERFFQGPGSDGERDEPGATGLGSGVIMNSNGYILTNNHVVDGADEISVKLSNGQIVKNAKVIGTDQPTDVAVIQIEHPNLVPAKLGNSDLLEVGHWVLAIGSPFELEQTVTAGIVSAVGRSDLNITRYDNFIQTDAAINPGNSGGPLVNLQGEVVGINTAIASRTGGYMGIGFAIPVNTARNIANTLVKDGHVERGWLGAQIQDLTEDMAKTFGVAADSGVVIGGVMPDSPAEKAGLQAEDIVVRLQDQPMTSAGQLRTAVAAFAPGTSVDLRVIRDGKAVSLRVTLGLLDEKMLTRFGRGAQPETEPEPEETTVADSGLSVQDLTAELAEQLQIRDDSGAVVVDVERGGVAQRAGIRVGDLIVAISGEPVAKAVDVTRLLTADALNQGVRIRLKRSGVTLVVVLKQS